MKKIILAVILILSFSLTALANGSRYNDVKPDDWFVEAVEKMSEFGVINGYPDGSFAPNKAVNRVEFATMMVKALNLELVKTKSTFHDVTNDYWGKKFIETAKPYLTGFTANGIYYFKPTLGAQREDMAVALVKALNIKTGDLSPLDPFEDKDQISKNLKPYVAAAVREGLMQGYLEEGKKYFKPKKTITRAEAATLLLNVIELEKITFDKIEKVVPGDEKPEPPTGEMKATVTATAHDGYVTLSWNKVTTSKGFWGYKVVYSKYNANPKYPEDGYAYYIRDNNKTSMDIYSGIDYHGNNDLGGVIRSGETYYVSITTLYKDMKIPGTVIRVTMP